MGEEICPVCVMFSCIFHGKIVEIECYVLRMFITAELFEYYWQLQHCDQQGAVEMNGASYPVCRVSYPVLQVTTAGLQTVARFSGYCIVQSLCSPIFSAPQCCN